MKKNQIAMIEWVGYIQYPNLKAVYAGTLFLEASVEGDEVREAFMEFSLKYLPKGFEIKEMIRGSVWFVPNWENT